MDFRKSITVNNRKTRLVVVSYIAIMTLVGLLADIAIRPLTNAGLLHDMQLYITFAAIPYVTLGILGLTLLGIFLISKFGHKLMLSGSSYRQGESVNILLNYNQPILDKNQSPSGIESAFIHFLPNALNPAISILSR